ncbi:hypothetical protein BDU57DRAFT_554843 [Ampelomyces quisqualis]|uniref:Postreplication repair E3 ubiquitin-protein ligase RAD18 n=1 Tax=Ampelomyces quisqualis TaxID=50730 RepID=A0A6A5QXC4_AMPQU|nr:hypothetical protein BDU57DRAFT_554843 [Ampelomyces quisqualis]
MDSTFDLPDSTDWIRTSLPQFEPLEAALRCEVCKEFFANPVITSCSHTFCSICIRRCIATDGKCPSCKSACSSDKLAPNIAVREVVMRFQDARQKALEMARADNEGEVEPAGKKRKLDETDIEDSEPTRQTRSRQMRSRGRQNGTDDAPVEVTDSDEDGDDDFLPEGMAKCPICNATMKAEQVYNHLDICPGQSGSQGRSTRSRTKTTFPNPLHRRQKEPSPVPTRLSQLNYAMLKESALRKKLQEIGIPNWGSKDLLKRRHIEWLNIYNSNCDAHESVRKSKRQLVKELDEWETTQGGKADSKDSKIMKKDFDGNGYAKSHKPDFDALIAKAKLPRSAPHPQHTPQLDLQSMASTSDAAHPDPDPNTITPQLAQAHHDSLPNNNTPPTSQHPYENNHSALDTIRAKVAAANATRNTLATLPPAPSLPHHQPPQGYAQGMQNPLGGGVGAATKVDMFSLPEQPVADTDSAGVGR